MTTPEDPQEVLSTWFTRRDAAKYLSIGMTTLDDLRSAGHLPSYRLRAGKVVLIKRSDLDALMKPAGPNDYVGASAYKRRARKVDGEVGVDEAVVAEAGGSA